MSKSLIKRLSAIILLTSVAFSGIQCIPIPTVTEKIVELAVGSSITMEFVSDGELNFHNDSRFVDVADSLDIEQLVADAGIDAGDLIDIALTGVAYRVSVPDPNPNRTIVNGIVKVQRQGGPDTPLVTDFTQVVNDAVDWTDAPLDPAGVAVINALLDELVHEANGQGPASNVAATFTVSGQSTPSNVPTDFTWEIRLYFSVVGSITMDMVDF